MTGRLPTLNLLQSHRQVYLRVFSSTKRQLSDIITDMLAHVVLGS